MITFVIISALAAARVWRLLVNDDAGVLARDWEYRLTSTDPQDRSRKARIKRSLHEGYHCPWCIGFWLCVGFIGLSFAPTWIFLLVAGPFAANYISANLNVHFGDKPE